MRYILKAFSRNSDFLLVPKEKKKFHKFVTPFFAHGHIYVLKLVSTYRRRQSPVATPLPVRGQSCLVQIWLRGNVHMYRSEKDVIPQKNKKKGVTRCVNN